MTIEEASKILADMYRKGRIAREQALSVHLFGIKYADAISAMPLAELVVRAGIPETYKTELRKGINLAKYVTVRA